jgi:UDP-N-acetylglucosamine--N-acetylmuramyl-(pentapeptide) pyrophosphoryl-undecaprenol N-acetylglucosamine transferase
VVLQTGEVDPEPYQKKHPEWKIIRYTERFNELIAGAHVVVTHFGATALEVLSYKKPMVIVGNPEWTRAAVFEDATVYAKKINAPLVLEVTLENVLDAIKSAEGREVPTLPDGANALAKIILNMC